MIAAALLDALEAMLLRIEATTPPDQTAWEADELRRLAIERLWIFAGNLAEEYRSAAALGAGAEPWAELYGYRSVLAHALPDEISPDRMWHETTVALPRLLEQVRAERR